MPTLLQINVTSNYGSTGKIAEQIGLLAEQNGWNCFLAHGPRYINPSQLHAIQINNRIDELIHGGLYSFLQDKHGLGSVNATKKFVAKIKNEIKPDIIHLHNIHGYYVNYKVLFDYLAEADIPVIWTLHDCWTFTGHCSHFDYEGCMRWKNECFDCPLSKEYPKSLCVDRSRRNYLLKKSCFTSLGNRLTLVPVSFWLEGLLRESFLKDLHMTTIHNGIDLNTFTVQSTEMVSRKYNLNNKIVLLGVAAPWTERKGLSDFMKLRTVLPEEYAIIMVGLSDKQISRLPEGIIGIKRTQNANELAQLYSVANIFVNTTYEDNYPTVNLEAIACGTPVITYNTGGSSESITPQTGIIVEQGNFNELVKAIYQLGKIDRNLIRNNCLMHAKQNFDRTLCFQKYIDLYSKILNS